MTQKLTYRKLGMEEELDKTENLNKSQLALNLARWRRVELRHIRLKPRFSSRWRMNSI